MERQHSGKSGIQSNNADDDEVDTIGYFVKRIVWHTEKHERTHSLVRWYGCTSKDDTLQAREHLPDNFIVRYWQCFGRRTTAANAQKNSSGRIVSEVLYKIQKLALKASALRAKHYS